MGNGSLKITRPVSNITSTIIKAKKDVLRGKNVYESDDFTISQRNQINKPKDELNNKRLMGIETSLFNILKVYRKTSLN